jgi:hypothetical protein
MSFFHLCRAEKYAGWLRNTRGNGQRRWAVVATRGPRQSCPRTSEPAGVLFSATQVKKRHRRQRDSNNFGRPVHASARLVCALMPRCSPEYCCRVIPRFPWPRVQHDTAALRPWHGVWKQDSRAYDKICTDRMQYIENQKRSWRLLLVHQKSHFLVNDQSTRFLIREVN